jgi:hypothetical protein
MLLLHTHCKLEHGRLTIKYNETRLAFLRVENGGKDAFKLISSRKITPHACENSDLDEFRPEVPRPKGTKTRKVVNIPAKTWRQSAISCLVSCLFLAVSCPVSCHA